MKLKEAEQVAAQKLEKLKQQIRENADPYKIPIIQPRSTETLADDAAYPSDQAEPAAISAPAATSLPPTVIGSRTAALMFIDPWGMSKPLKTVEEAPIEQSTTSQSDTTVPNKVREVTSKLKVRSRSLLSSEYARLCCSCSLQFLFCVRIFAV